MPDKEWLDSLKVGDSVCYNSNRYGGEPKYNIHRIVKITPTRRFNLNNGMQFQSDGTYKIGSDAWASYYYLKPLTQKRLDYVKKQDLISMLGGRSFKGLPLEVLEEVHAVLFKAGAVLDVSKYERYTIQESE